MASVEDTGMTIRERLRVKLYDLSDLVFYVFIAIIVGFVVGYDISSQILPQFVIAVLGASATLIGVVYAIYHNFGERRTRRIMLDIIHQEDLLSYIINVHWRLHNHIDAISQRHEFTGSWGHGMTGDAKTELEGLIDKSIIEQLSKYENLSRSYLIN